MPEKIKTASNEILLDDEYLIQTTSPGKVFWTEMSHQNPIIARARCHS